MIFCSTHRDLLNIYYFEDTKRCIKTMKPITWIKIYHSHTFKKNNNWTRHWNEHVPKLVETGQGVKVTILCNQKVKTDRTIPNNKPEIIIRDNEKGTYTLIDVAISGDRNWL
jgi:hypothetical protein